MTEITKEIARKFYHYDPSTGIMTRAINSGKGKSGDMPKLINAHGYFVVSIAGTRILLHRLAWIYMYGSVGSYYMDHINHDRTDNRISNLRLVTRQENQRNHKKHKHNTSGLMGVCWDKQYSKWRVRINIAGKGVLLGMKKDFFEACCLRLSANNKHGFHENHGRVAS